MPPETTARTRRAGLWLFAALAIGSTLARAADGEKKTDWDLRGRVAPQLLVSTFPDNSLFREAMGSRSQDFNLDARFMFELEHGRWSFDIDYQLIALYGDTFEFARELPAELRLLIPGIPDDDRRLFDLTHVIADDDNGALLQRFDRLSARHVTEKTVVRIGRQAISWGNGLIYTPMDIFNPFDPAAVDREFKTGDDMLYGQLLRGNGDDTQGVLVVRRNPATGDVEADVGSLAFKYHALIGKGELDVLAALHYGDTLLGAGGNISVGGALWRGDLVLDFTESDPTPSLVTSLSHSWVWSGKNFSGVLEYFYNGFGQSDGCYSPQCLEQNPELLERLARGEVFTLARNYIAATTTIEVTPLFRLTPTLFTNLGDPSALLQIATLNDLRENLVLWGAIGVPIGADGTEFGGAPSSIDGVYLSRDISLFLQLGWYW